MERLPVQSASADAVVSNASLPYARDVRVSLRNIARVLRPGGFLAILNSPVHTRPTSAARAQADFRARLRSLEASHEVVSTCHHFTRSELVSDVLSTVGPVEETWFDSGLRFRWSRRLKGLAPLMGIGPFPIFMSPKKPEKGAPAG